MPNKKTPEKGQPDFSNLDDNRVRQYKDMVTDLIGNFSECPEIQESLKTAWRYLNEECTERTCSMPEVENKPKILKTRFLKKPLGKKLLST